MPNVALLVGAGLIGALLAGLFLLYNDDGFSQHHSYEHDVPRYRPRPAERSPPRWGNEGSNNDRGSKGSSSSRTNNSARIDTSVEVVNNKRRRRYVSNQHKYCVHSNFSAFIEMF